MISPSDLTDAPKVVPATAFGRRFRSTTEARWAVFLTDLGVPWEYEQETYDLGQLGWYLPDFWLTREGWFLEVKPGRTQMLDQEYDKAKALHMTTGRPVLVANGYGLPGDHWFRGNEPGWIYDMFTFDQQDVSAGGGGAGHHFVICSCGRIGLSFHGYGTRCAGNPGHRADWDRLLAAYSAGASYRPDER
jgi:hypothetical protein